VMTSHACEVEVRPEQADDDEERPVGHAHHVPRHAHARVLENRDHQSRDQAEEEQREAEREEQILHGGHA